MSGLLVLAGGHEHRGASRVIDRAVVRMLDAPQPRVAVVPAASSIRKRPAVEMLARRYWTTLGADVDLIPLDLTSSAQPPAALREADLIVLPGGHPARLAYAARRALWPHIIRRWRQGAALSGSSAGAMVLCEWRQQLAPPHALRMVKGFGLVKACAAAPHFNRPVIRRWALTVSYTLPRLTVLGIDEYTAIVGRDDRFTVHGVGAVTVLRDGVGRRYVAGEQLPRSLAAALRTRTTPLSRVAFPDDDAALPTGVLVP